MRMQECGRGREHGHGFGHMGRKMAKMMAMRGRGGPGGGEGPWSGRFDDSGGRGGRGGPGGRGRRRMFAGGELRLLLLRLIADETRHGYELIKAIEELTGGEYAPSPGVVYPTLSLLVDEGMIAEAEGEGPRKAFTVTAEGSTELAGRTDEAEALKQRLTALADDRERGDSPPVRRAVANLLTALRQRAMAGEIERETAHQIAEILDDAARRIERL